VTGMAQTLSEVTLGWCLKGRANLIHLV